MMVLLRVYLSHDTGLDWLTADEFGRTDDDGQVREVSTGRREDLGFVHDAPDGRVLELEGEPVSGPERVVRPRRRRRSRGRRNLVEPLPRMVCS